LYPTILDLARVDPRSKTQSLEGRSLVPYLFRSEKPETGNALSYFHGTNNAMSWFMVLSGDSICLWKEEISGKLYNLRTDPDERNNL
jgi:hypothetical protein